MRLQFLILSLLILSVLSFHCQTSQRIGWISFSTLSGLDHIAIVFARINLNLTSQNQTQTYHDQTYALNDFKIEAWHDNSNQTQSYLNETTSKVECGKLTISYDFNYVVGGDKKGTASGNILAERLNFNKGIYLNNGSLSWELGALEEVKLSGNITIQKSEPALSETDKQVFELILNDKLDNESKLISNSLKQLNQLLKPALDAYLKSEHIVVLTNQVYQYKNFTVDYDIKIIQNRFLNDTDFKGLRYKSLYEVKDFTDDCKELQDGFMTEFGGFQQIIAFPWLKANFMYAVKNGLFTINLNSKDWDTNLFQFFMGDIGNVIEESQKEEPSIAIVGKCEWNSNAQVNTTLDYFTFDSIYTKIPMACSIWNDRTNVTIQKFTFNFGVSLALKLAKNYLSVVVKTIEVLVPKFETQGKYVVTDNDLAQYYLKNVTQKLLGATAFGNKFETSRRKLPSLRLKYDYLIMYDGSEN